MAVAAERSSLWAGSAEPGQARALRCSSDVRELLRSLAPVAA